METIEAAERVSAGLQARAGFGEDVLIHGRYTAVCRDADGNVTWTEEFDNLVTTVGKNDLLDRYFTGNGTTSISAYTPAHFLGLKGTGTAAAGDTMASHAGWSEVGGTNAPAYSGTRATPAWSAAGSGSKVMSAAATFTFTSGGTVAGCFMVRAGTSAQDNTTGTLYSAGDFGASRTVITGDSLAVTYTASA